MNTLVLKEFLKVLFQIKLLFLHSQPVGQN